MNNTNLLVEDTPVTGISVQEDISVFTFKGIKNSTSAAAQCFGLLDDLKINVDMISQQIDDQGNCSISFSCTKAQGESLESNMPCYYLISISVDAGSFGTSLGSVRLSTPSLYSASILF